MLCNSLGTNLAMWDAQIPALAGRFRVVRYDRRGHGLSPVPPGPYSIDDLGADALSLLDELGLERVSFCGLSIGGAVGMWLALEAPERLDRLVLCCTRPSFPPREQWVERAAVVREWWSGRQSPEAALESLVHRAVLQRASERGRLLQDDARGDAGRGLRRLLRSARDVRPPQPPRRITAPTLVVTGEADPVAPPEIGDEIAAAIPGATHVVIADAAHIANVEQADAFTTALLAHLDNERGDA